MPSAVVVLIMLHWELCILLFGAMAGTTSAAEYVYAVRSYTLKPREWNAVIKCLLESSAMPAGLLSAS